MTTEEETDARVEDLVRRARARLIQVYNHYTAEEIARANPSSQLGNWRDGLAILDEALEAPGEVEGMVTR